MKRKRNKPVPIHSFRKSIIKYLQQPGFLIFSIILLYFIIKLASYTFSNHISTYEVTMGQITDSKTYTGLAIRSETIYSADRTGYINYYKKEGDKVAARNVICSIDTNGSIAKKITNAGKNVSKLTSTNLFEIQSVINTYLSSYQDNSYGDVYDFKNKVNAMIQEDLYANALKKYSAETDRGIVNRTFSFYNARTDGDVTFYTDGYENIKFDQFKSRNYSPSTYSVKNLKINTKVKSGAPIYKLVTSEKWNILVPLNADEIKLYQNEKYLKITFNKDKNTAVASAKIMNYDGKKFLALSLNSGMVRYISQRYLDIQINTDTSKGLKIPNSAITYKKFYVVPKKYVTTGGDSSKNGVLVLKNGKSTPEFVATDLYYEEDNNYYIEKSMIGANNRLQMPNSTATMELTTVKSLPGVYNVNKGYAVFKILDVIGKNSEFTIAKTGSNYGLTIYDHIALDASDIKENQMIR